MGCLQSRESSKPKTTSVRSSIREQTRQSHSSTINQYTERNNGSSPHSNIGNFRPSVPTLSRRSTSQQSISQANIWNVGPSIPTLTRPNTSQITSHSKTLDNRSSILTSNVPARNQQRTLSTVKVRNLKPMTRPSSTLQHVNHFNNLDNQSSILTSNVSATKQQLTFDSDVPYGCKKLYPSKIRYMQDSIASTFYKNGRHGGVKIGITLDELLKGKTQIKDIPRITVCRHNKQWFSFDNRRLWVFRTYEAINGPIQIIVNVASDIDVEKFTTNNNGTSIHVRGDPGGFYWKRYKNRM